MILADSRVWVDYLRGTPTPQADKLDALLGTVPLAVVDLTLTAALQGCPTDKAFNEVRRMLLNPTVVPLGGQDVAIEAARNDRRLRALGLTVRKTLDSVDPDALHRRQTGPAALRSGIRPVRAAPRTPLRGV